MTIKPIGIFHTPRDWDELMDWINGHHSDERAHLIVASGMTWNLACKLAPTTDKKED